MKLVDVLDHAKLLSPTSLKMKDMFISGDASLSRQ